MKISQILSKEESGVSFEFFPPKTDTGRVSLRATVEAVLPFKPLYTSMTYGAAGAAQEKTLNAVELLLGFDQLTVMPHLTCVETTKGIVKPLLDDYRAKGIENIMALRGDAPAGVSDKSSWLKDFSYALDLVSFIKSYGGFCLGVAVYPEGHIESPNLKKDLEFTKQKIDSGADFGVTQMFFDNKFFYSMLERFDKEKIKIPILPGILPLTDIAKVKKFASICRTTIPKDTEEAMLKFASVPEDMEKVGIELTIKQCCDLIKNGAKRLHFFTLNKPQVIKQIVEGIL